uniref:Hydroxyproline-rich glycoprotein n=1 Tax=Populus tomentosa TaxID=118781 RepID=A0A3S9LK90_POPTO|nr:hydroxyproline-rich glycoprotein [Populus tomentosa]
MESFNAGSWTPLSVLCERRSEPRKSLSLPTVSPLKISHSFSTSTSRSTTQECLSRTLHGGIVLLSSVLSNGLARALTYQEALEQSARSFSSDANGVLDSVIKFGTENPTIVAGSVTVLAVPLVLSLVLNKSKSWGVESAKKAYEALGVDANAQLLDIRAPVEFRQVGSPDIRGLSKKPVPIVYEGEDKPGFLKKLSLKFKEPENITLFILDKFDGNSELVAELVTVNGFKGAYAIKDGAEGPRGWMNSGLPWIPPKKAFSLDLGDLSDAIGGALGEGSDALPVTFAIAAATGIGVLAFSEIEAILQVLGSAALIQFVSKKLLFAKDRKQTLEQVDEFLTTKIAPKEFVDELKDIGKALLPVAVTSKALPAPAEASPEPAAADSSVQNAEAAPQINSAPKTEAKAELVSGFSRPLSPYPTVIPTLIALVYFQSGYFPSSS